MPAVSPIVHAQSAQVGIGERESRRYWGQQLVVRGQLHSPLGKLVMRVAHVAPIRARCFNSKRTSFHVALELEHVESVDLRSEVRKADAVLPVFARAGQRSDTLKRVARRGRCRLLFLLGVQHICRRRTAPSARPLSTRPSPASRRTLAASIFALSRILGAATGCAGTGMFSTPNPVVARSTRLVAVCRYVTHLTPHPEHPRGSTLASASPPRALNSGRSPLAPPPSAPPPSSPPGVTPSPPGGACAPTPPSPWSGVRASRTQFSPKPPKAGRGSGRRQVLNA